MSGDPLPTWTVVGFTGHRNLDNPRTAEKGIAEALDRVASRCGAVVALSSAAKGADTLFAEEAARRKLPLLLVLPFPAARFEKDFEPADWQRVVPLLGSAVHIDEISDFKAGDNESYMECGARVVDRADVMVAVWDGKPANGLGGTGDIVGYARDLNKPLLWIDANTGAIVEERIDRAPKRNGVSVEGKSPRQAAQDCFDQFTTAAKLHAPRARLITFWYILLHLIAPALVLTPIVVSIFRPLATGFGIAEPVILGVAFWLYFGHRRSHAEWVRNRVGAEICRSFLATWPIRQHARYVPKIALKEFEPLVDHLHLLQQLDRTPAPEDLTVARDNYCRVRVTDQIEYFRREGDNASRKYSALRTAAKVCTLAAAACSVFVLILHRLHGNEQVIEFSELLSLILPLVSAGIFTYLLSRDYSRRNHRYHEVAEILEAARSRLNAARTWSGLARIAAQTEEELLQEVIEWHSFARFAGELH